MKNLCLIFFTFVFLASCLPTSKNIDMMEFRTGTFEIPASDKYSSTTFTRTDTLQIETYANRIDSLSIHWKDNFNYTLRMLHPKSKLDKELIRVKITKVTSDSYNFEAIIGHSNFVQKGTVKKIKD